MADPVPAPGEPWAAAHDPALTAVLEASPVATLVVDDGARILFLNRAARRAMGIPAGADGGRIGRARSGDLLGCLPALSDPGGCGQAPSCGECILHGAVQRAIAGSAVVRAQVVFQVERPEGFDELTFLVSAAPVRVGGGTVVLLTLEDLSEMALLVAFAPACRAEPAGVNEPGPGFAAGVGSGADGFQRVPP